MKKIDLFARARGREFSKGGRRGWYGWREREMDYTTDGPPPKYPGYDGDEDLSENKTISSQRKLDAFHSPMTAPTGAKLDSAAVLSKGTDTQRQEAIRVALLI